MRSNFRPLFWIEIGLAAITGLLALITPIFPDWIEFVSGWDPDQHDGSVWLGPGPMDPRARHIQQRALPANR